MTHTSSDVVLLYTSTRKVFRPASVVVYFHSALNPSCTTSNTRFVKSTTELQRASVRRAADGS